jgi:hypothetical protein
MATNLELVKENIQLKHQQEVQVALFMDKNYQIHADEFHFYNLIYTIFYCSIVLYYIIR